MCKALLPRCWKPLPRLQNFSKEVNIKIKYEETKIMQQSEQKIPELVRRRWSQTKRTFQQFQFSFQHKTPIISLKIRKK